MLRQSIKKLQLSAHSLTLKEVFSLSQSSLKGIAEKEAKERLKIFGRNELPEKKPLNFFDFLFSQINNFLVYIIFFSALISLFLRRFIDAFFIVLVILLNVIIGAFQEYKAEKTFEKLKKLIKEKVRVIREGREEIISKEEVVPGDILVLRKGDKVPADARVIESFALSCNQASLTGEFFPQEKNSEILPLKTEITERKNIILASSLVVAGAGKAIVIATGLDSYLGKIYQLLFEKKFKEEKSLLQRKIEKFVKVVVRIIISLVFLNGIIALGKGYKFSDVFLASVSLVVSAVPEGLLPLITIVLIFGARNLFRKKSLLRRLSSLETLGSITTIVTDKTGTLTEGKMTLVKILAFAKGKFIPTSKSYKANGIFSSHYLALRTSVLSSDAFIENLDKPAKRMIVRGSPTEKAIVFAGLENGLIKNELLKNLPQVDFLPFDSEIKFSASLNLDKKKKVFLFSLLGSPEVILEKSVKLYDQGKLVKLNEEKRKKIEREINKLTEEGYRVLACAFKEIKKENYQQSTPLKDLSFDLNFLGLLVLEDPLRKESFSTLKILREAGVRTIIATGDNKLTAFKVALNLGLKIKKREIVLGSEIREMKREELKELVKKRNVFAQVIPEDKLKIVEALKENGEIVAMVGDGVNDAPSIKRADVGVVLNSGSQITKESGDLILVDNNLNSLKESIIEGRNIVENLRKVIIYLISDDFSEIILFIFAMIFSLPLPLLPTQILWINLIEDGLPGIALAFEKERVKELLKRQKEKGEILTREIKKWMVWVGIITGLTACLSFFVFLQFFSLEKTRTILFVLMAFDSLVYAFSLRNLRKPIFETNIFANKYLNFSLLFGLLVLLFSVYSPWGERIFSSLPLNFLDWLIVFSISLLELLFIEIAKKKILRG